MSVNSRRRFTKSTLGRPQGYATSKPKVRPLMVILVVEKRRVAQPRYFGRAKLGKKFGGQVVPGTAFVVQPNVLRPVSTMFTRRRLESSHLTRPRIIPAAPAAPRHVRAIQVVGATLKRAAITRRFDVKTTLGAPHGSHIVVPRPHVLPIRVVGQAVARMRLLPRLRTEARLGHPSGHRTRNPPVRAIRTVEQAVNRRTYLARLRVHSTFTHVFGSATLPPPPPPPPPVGPSGGSASGGGGGWKEYHRSSGGKVPKLDDLDVFQELSKGLAEGRPLGEIVAGLAGPAILPPPPAPPTILREYDEQGELEEIMHILRNVL